MWYVYFKRFNYIIRAPEGYISYNKDNQFDLKSISIVYFIWIDSFIQQGRINTFIMLFFE